MQFKIHYSIMGSVPQMEPYKDSIEQVIERYIDQKQPDYPDVGQMSDDEKAGHISKDVFTERFDHMTNALLIELCARHFFGLKAKDFETTEQLIEAMRSIDTE